MFGRPVESWWSAEQRLWWLLWSRVPGFGYKRLRQLEAACGTLAAAWAAPSSQLAALPGVGPALLASIDRHRQRWGQAPLTAWRRSGQAVSGVLLPGDRALPVAVRALAQPPPALYWRGAGSLWAPLRQRRAVAVVGTRRPSPQGLAMAEAIGAALARGGWPVVSGLAEGIDGAAHHGCLQAGGRPVGVLGTALERVYPKHHRVLQQQVGRQGLLISEQAPGAPVCAGHFAARNRLQVALAEAVVLVECPENSGALHAARMAWHQGLPVWVVPGEAARTSDAGSNAFLQQGPTALVAANDLLRALGPGPLTSACSATPASGSADQELVAAVGLGSSLEQLSLNLGQTAGELMPRLLALELAGVLRAEPGLHWRPA